MVLGTYLQWRVQSTYPVLTLLWARNLIEKDLAAKGLATQSVVLVPAASALRGSLLEMKLFSSTQTC